MSENKIKLNSKIHFHHLQKKSLPDKKGFYIVVCTDTDKTLKLEKDAFKALKCLEKGYSVTESSKIIGRTPQEVIGLVNTLGESGFIKSIDGASVPSFFSKIKPFKFFLSQKQLQFLTSKYLWLATLILILVGFYVSLVTPEIAPSFRQYFWTKNMLVVYFSLFLLETLFVFLHEFVHFAVTLAVGGQARVRISNRFINLVAETESYSLSLVDKPKRYLVYLSAMAFNLSVISIIYLLLGQTSFYLSFTTRALLQAIVLLNIQGVIWQFNLFLQTDLYNFISDFLENDNLHNNSMLFIIEKIQKSRFLSPLSKTLNLKKIKTKLIPDADDIDILDISERRHLILYSILFIAGIIFISLQYLAFIIPRDLFFISTSINEIIKAVTIKNLSGILGSLALIFLVTWKYFALGIIYLKKNQKHGTVN